VSIDRPLIAALRQVTRTPEELAKVDELQGRWQELGARALKDFIYAEPSLFMRVCDLTNDPEGTRNALVRVLDALGINLMELEKKKLH
jgi:hypothetical protein